ncbi:MAG TPA: hypothetical protein VFX97_13040 [Pyrinomonadaceae bacterium]|nr:hypothetical protein [Pyrinomonadaceae bacterium]
MHFITSLLSCATVLFVIPTAAKNFAQPRPANTPGCTLIESSRPPHYIAYEGTKPSAEISLRLRNNTTCEIVIETDDSIPAQLRRFPNGDVRIEPVIGSADGVRVALHYLVEDRQRQKAPQRGYGWGDSVFSYQVQPGHSVIFRIPRAQLKRGLDIVVPFKYAWETSSAIGMGAGGVVHRVYFLFDDFPPTALKK